MKQHTVSLRDRIYRVVSNYAYVKYGIKEDLITNVTFEGTNAVITLGQILPASTLHISLDAVGEM